MSEVYPIETLNADGTIEIRRNLDEQARDYAVSEDLLDRLVSNGCTSCHSSIDGERNFHPLTCGHCEPHEGMVERLGDRVHGSS